MNSRIHNVTVGNHGGMGYNLAFDHAPFANMEGREFEHYHIWLSVHDADGLSKLTDWLTQRNMTKENYLALINQVFKNGRGTHTSAKSRALCLEAWLIAEKTNLFQKADQEKEEADRKDREEFQQAKRARELTPFAIEMLELLKGIPVWFQEWSIEEGPAEAALLDPIRELLARIP